VRLRVLTWNLFHGRALPGAGHDLAPEFGEALAGWEWDVALLQEVPPWWPAVLGASLGCEVRSVLTSRNGLLPLRRAAARRFPDVMRSGGGGCNAILCRSDRIADARTQRLCRAPEQRWVSGVELACGAWVCTLHASSGPSPEAARDVHAAGGAALAWSAGRPVVLAGDLNLRAVSVEGFSVLASSDVDHVLGGAGVTALGGGDVLAHGALSDHAPLTVTVEVGVWACRSEVGAGGSRSEPA
jgi:endonuclease/exonuclease/phosphatase family metal-dependent hydrolase